MATPTQTRRRGRLSLLLGSMVAAIVLLAAGAYADNIANNIDATVDANFEALALNQSGPDGSVGLYVVPTSGDGKNGCNLTGSTVLTVSIQSSNTSVATVGPSPVPLTHCGEPVTPITVHPVGQGTATITMAQAFNNTGATFQFNTATFTVNVAPPPNTPPTVDVTGVEEGGSYVKGAVPAAGCQVSDTEDGLTNSTTAASPNVGPVQGPNAADGIGQQTVTCSYTDQGGLKVVASATYAIVDPSPPTIGSTLNPASPNGSNGWYTSDVSLTWQVNEPDSPSSLGIPAGQCVDQTITSDQGPTTYTCSASSVGGSATPQSVTIKRDASKPTITASATTPSGPYTGGWTNQTVTVHFACSDVGPSGLAEACPDDVVVSASTSVGGQNVSDSIADLAGNVGHSNVVNVKVDKVAPVISLDSRTTANTNGWNNTDVALHWSCSDALSGPVASSDSALVQSEGAGQSATGHCADNAGNTASDTVSGINIDKTAPTGVVATFARDADHSGWYNAPVVISASGTDALSGIADCDSALYSGPDSATASASRGCTDKAGNNAADSVSFKFDDTDPTLSPSVSPNPVVLNGSATAAAGADDATSGVDAANTGCGQVSTSSVGAHAVACDATDNAGNQASKSATYSVVYATGGSCLGSPGHQILQPINASWSVDLSVFKQGSTVPAKFRVCDANGVSIGTAGVVTKFALVQKLGLDPSQMIDEAVLSTTPDTAFRWSSTDQQWIFNIATKTLKASTTYVYQITLNDGSTIDFRFGLK